VREALPRRAAEDASAFELVVPAFNEARSLPELLARTARAAEAAQWTPERFRLVIVENGSGDTSRQVLDELQRGADGSWLRVVALEENRGYGAGLIAGLRATTAPLIGWSHADLQCDPGDALRAATRLLRGDSSMRLVKGIRKGRDPKDVVVSRSFETLARVILGLDTFEMNAQPKVFARALLDELVDPPEDFAFDLYLLYRARRAGYTFETIDVRFPPREHGTSNWAASFVSRRRTMTAMLRYMLALARREGRL
jgi:glycosyltransferase involved in cell wall biosynthesis